jgi:hypothetical protein
MITKAMKQLEAPVRKKRRGPGRPKHEPTDQMRGEVRAYATIGTPHKDIALLINLSLETLLKHYPEELAMGKARGIAQVAKTLYECATVLKQPWAVCFYLKVQAGWRETSVIQNQTLGADGNPVDPPKLGISFERGGPGLPKVIDESLPFEEPEEEITDTGTVTH